MGAPTPSISLMEPANYDSAPGALTPDTKQRAKQRWKKIKTAVHIVGFTVKAKKFTLSRETKLLKGASARTRQILVGAILLSMLGCGVLSAETKAATFHMSAVGLYGNGEEYPFKYVWSMTLFTFVAKLMLVLMHSKGGKKHKHEEPEEVEDEEDGTVLVTEEIPLLTRMLQYAKPLFMLILISIFDMLGSSLASLSLSVGTPTSVFVVFKSAKIVFVAVVSVLILRVYVSKPQWGALVIMTLSMTVAAFAEGKKKASSDASSLLGPILLLVGELCHAIQIVLQEICVKKYLMAPGVVIGGSSVFGCVMAVSACIAATRSIVPLYSVNGDLIGEHPQSSISDTFAMMSNNPYLGIAFFLHIVSLALADVAAVSLAKHVNSIARVLVDALKLMVMWLLGKLFVVLGTCVYLQEPWHNADPIIGSWMMIPAMASISYSLLMYQRGVWLPITYDRLEGWVIQSQKVTEPKSPKRKTVLTAVKPTAISGLKEPLLGDGAEANAFESVVEEPVTEELPIRVTKIGLDHGWDDLLPRMRRQMKHTEKKQPHFARSSSGLPGEGAVRVRNSWGVVKRNYRTLGPLNASAPFAVRPSAPSAPTDNRLSLPVHRDQQQQQQEQSDDKTLLRPTTPVTATASPCSRETTAHP